MKNGLLVYSSEYDLFNVGDYIQSIAARQFFQNDIDTYVCREELNNYLRDDIKLIMNGWFTHKSHNWPPSEKIHPLFISFHINSVAVKDLTSPTSIAYLKKHEPIGCRDYKTVSVLTENGINAYFTGCLTLTLGETYKRDFIDENIYFVDPFFKFEKKLPDLFSYSRVLLSNFFILNKISKKLFGNSKFKNLLKTGAFYKLYSEIFEDDVLTDAIYIKQELSNDTFSNDNEKFDYADSLLKKYTAAKFVVTNRIHCALPCTSIGTPVLYVNNENQSETSYCRLDGIVQLFNVINVKNNSWSCDLVENKKIGKTFQFKNKNLHNELKENLIKHCRDFLN
jgi:hypothetical protein